ncbi:GDSL-type esterase/lipase family protein [Corynebacterium kutscheri]|uniref:GDSL-type esterase/lipase family protein n=1 Tax=Corynebacterium kutscheri TaxID=35755 RepID=UPI0037C109E1
MTTFRRRLAAVLCTLAATCTVATVPHASAAPNAFVAFGDSIMANPTVDGWFMSKVTAGSSGSSGSSDVDINRGCATDRNGLVKQAAARLGMAAWDYSCPGATAHSGGKVFATQINEAIADGALDASTRVVVIQIGINDTHAAYTKGIPADVLHNNYVSTMVPEIQRIRQAAPHAQIKMIGYPSITDNNYTVCLAQWGFNLHTIEALPMATHFENQAEAMQRDVAQRTGIQFVDVRAQSMGHGMCASDEQRWMGAFIDLGAARNMPVHLTDNGKAQVARIIAES